MTTDYKWTRMACTGAGTRTGHMQRKCPCNLTKDGLVLQVMAFPYVFSREATFID